MRRNPPCPCGALLVRGLCHDCGLPPRQCACAMRSLSPSPSMSPSPSCSPSPDPYPEVGGTTKAGGTWYCEPAQGVVDPPWRFESIYGVTALPPVTLENELRLFAQQCELKEEHALWQRTQRALLDLDQGVSSQPAQEPSETLPAPWWLSRSPMRPLRIGMRVFYGILAGYGIFWLGLWLL